MYGLQSIYPTIAIGDPYWTNGTDVQSTISIPYNITGNASVTITVGEFFDSLPILMTGSGIYQTVNTYDTTGNYIICLYVTDGNQACGRILSPITIPTSIASPLGTIKIITIGDIHATTGISNLTAAINWANTTDADIVVLLGDMANSATTAQYSALRTVTDTCNKTLYTIPGNHDLDSGPLTNYTAYYGSTYQPVRNVNGLQILSISIANSANPPNFGWSFDFANPAIDKNAPTVVFMHGPIMCPPSDCTCCNWTPCGSSTTCGMFGYARCNPSNIQTELGQFTNIKAIVDGHIHLETLQTLTIGSSPNIICATNAALITSSIGQCGSTCLPACCPPDGDNYCAGIATNNVGYLTITPAGTSYQLMDYTLPFVTPTPTPMSTPTPTVIPPTPTITPSPSPTTCPISTFFTT